MEWQYAVDGLSQQPVQPVYTLVGTEAYLARAFVDRLAETVAANCEVHRFWLDEAGLEAALLDLQSLSLFGDKALTVLEQATSLSSDSKTKIDLSALEAYLAQPAADRTLVIIVPAEKMDERRKVAKLLKKYPVVNCNTPADAAAVQLLEQMARDLALRPEPGAFAEVWRRSRSITAAANELVKLKSYIEEQGIMTVADVQELITPAPEDNVFAWIDGVMHGRLQQAVGAVADLEHAGYDTFSLFALLQRQLRLLWYAKVGSSRGMSPPDIAKTAGAHPYAVKVALGQVRSLSLQQIERLIVTVADAEFEVKSGRMDPDHALTWVLVACSQSTRRGKRAI